jgi:pyruvate dehydrogenase E2 component (dihydrolipoamide acetyltransferase)
MTQETIGVPNIGDAHDVDVVEVLVGPGARVEREQTLIVLESEKASMDVPSPQAGVVREVKIKVGDKASEGTPILVLEVESGQPSAEPKKAAQNGNGSPAASAAASSAAAKAPEPARATSAISEPPKPPERAAPQAAVPSAQQPSAAAVAVATPSRASAAASLAEEQEQASHLPYASPAIRRVARELGVDLTRVTGTARRGRITKHDVNEHVKKALRSQASGAGSVLALADAPDIDFSQFGAVSTQPLTKIQRLTGKNLHRSWVTIPHVTQFDQADITELEEFRKQVRKEQPELKLTLVTFFMKALVFGLKRMPRFNASLDKSGESLTFKHYFHVGVAVDTPNGLVVPVIRDVDKKTLGDLAKELEAISERARAKRLTPTDMQGASMTISSLGGLGGTAFTPIINPPEVAVLGVSRASIAPVYRDGSFVPRLMCPISLSYDHRVIDGADGARFTTLLRGVLGDVRQLLL